MSDYNNKVHEAAEELTTSFRENNRAFVESALTALDLNTRFAQSLFESGIAVLNAHAANTRQLTHLVVSQSHRQQEAFQTLMRASLDAYLNFFTAASSFYLHSLESAERSSNSLVEAAEKATHDAVQAGEKPLARQWKRLETLIDRERSPASHRVFRVDEREWKQWPQFFSSGNGRHVLLPPTFGAHFEAVGECVLSLVSTDHLRVGLDGDSLLGLRMQRDLIAGSERFG